MTKRLMVFGATGLTGRAAVACARAAGHPVVAHVRPDSGRLAEWRGRFRELGAELDTTPWGQSAMPEALARHQPDAVLLLLGTTRRRARDAKSRGADPAEESYERVDYGLTAEVRRAAEGAARHPRLVYLSSLGVKPGAKNPYLAARAKLEAELAAGSCPYVIARPSFIVGERDRPRAAESVGATAVDGLLGALAAVGFRGPHDRFASMTGEELARALVALATETEPPTVVETPGLRRRAS